MQNKLYKNITKLIPELFSVEITSNDYDLFFKIINRTIDFNDGYIFLLNSDDIQIKSSYNGKKFKFGETFDINLEIANKLFREDSEILNCNSKLIKLLKLESKNYLVSKLSIKGSIFGFVMLGREKLFITEEIEAMQTIACVLAYKIKDIELSNVFKIQLKALKNAIQETHEAYHTIKAQNKKILAADKIKNEFLASVSHELRTPLNAIIGFSDILTTQVYGELNEKQSEYVKDIQVSGIQLLGMVNEILDISKIEANAIKLVKRYFEISRPIFEVSNILMPLVKAKDISLTNSIENDIDIYADYQKIQQVLYNLLSNAIKYTPKNGKIHISTKNTRKYVKISVQDTGIGIAPKDQKRIFEKFVQLEDAFYKKETSTGLGLAITKKLVEMHKGNIKVESEKSKGANFIVTLPIELTDEPQT